MEPFVINPVILLPHYYPMKYLPLVTLLTAASAFGQTAVAPSTLFANNVSLTYAQVSTSGIAGHKNEWSASATAYLGTTEAFVQAATNIGGDLGNGGDLIQVGYRFKNVAGIADAALAIGSNERYTVALHRALGAGFGAWISYVREHDDNQLGFTVSKMLTHDYSVDLSYARAEVSTFKSDIWALGVRRKF